MTTRSEKLEFEGSQGATLAARIEWPLGEVRASALFVHCFTCSKDFVASSRIARALAERGIAVLRFDFTGLGESAGEFANTDFSSNVADIVRAADALGAALRPPSILVGHSLGGSAVLAAAGELPDAVAVATIGAPFDPAHVARLFADAHADIEARGSARVTLAGREFTVRRQLLDDLSEQHLAARIAGLRKSLLVMHSPVDEVVGIDHASRIFTAARHPKSFVSLDDADHLLSRRRDTEYVAEVLAAWSSRYLPREATQPRAPEAPSAEPGEVVVREAGEGVFTQAIAAGPHVLRADEPRELGGDDTGPTPYGLLLAALGACTSMTLRMYARRKQLPLERVTVRLRHDRIHAKDCEQCETRSGRVDRIEREIALEGELDAATRARLLEIADRCPVHRTLRSEVVVVTKEADA